MNPIANQNVIFRARLTAGTTVTIQANSSASIIYAIAYYVSENNGMSNEEKIKIDSLNNVILKIQKDQLRLDSTIVEFNKEIDKIDNSIGKIKSQKNADFDTDFKPITLLF